LDELNYFGPGDIKSAVIDDCLIRGGDNITVLLPVCWNETWPFIICGFSGPARANGSDILINVHHTRRPKIKYLR
jgi:hypothetical protein